MYKIVFILNIVLVLFSCDNKIETEPQDNNNTNKFDIVGKLEMTSGPHDLAVSGDYLFACINDKIDIIDISDVSSPTKVTSFDDLEAGNDFEALYIEGNTLFAACYQTSGVYAIDISNPNSVSISEKNINEVFAGTKLKALDLFADGNILWASGSNGTSGILVKYNASTLEVLDYYQLSGSGNGAEGVWANSSNVFISTIDGHVYSFDKDNISGGYIGEYTFTNEPGHGHWGRSITGKDNKLFWADWGAGFITINISNPANLTADALITQSSFKNDFSDAEGTNVYDVLIHKKNGMIYLANGWSGLVEVDPSNPGHVASYKDYKDNQYYCIEQYKDYVIVGDIAEGTTDMKGIKIIKVTD